LRRGGVQTAGIRGSTATTATQHLAGWRTWDGELAGWPLCVLHTVAHAWFVCQLRWVSVERSVS
jgi:hypothetical protein